VGSVLVRTRAQLRTRRPPAVCSPLWPLHLLLFLHLLLRPTSVATSMATSMASSVASSYTTCVASSYTTFVASSYTTFVARTAIWLSSSVMCCVASFTGP